MIDEGFGDDDPANRLAMLHGALLRNCRFAASIGIHTKGMTRRAGREALHDGLPPGRGDRPRAGGAGHVRPGLLRLHARQAADPGAAGARPEQGSGTASRCSASTTRSWRTARRRWPSCTTPCCAEIARWRSDKASRMALDDRAGYGERRVDADRCARSRLGRPVTRRGADGDPCLDGAAGVAARGRLDSERRPVHALVGVGRPGVHRRLGVEAGERALQALARLRPARPRPRRCRDARAGRRREDVRGRLVRRFARRRLGRALERSSRKRAAVDRGMRREVAKRDRSEEDARPVGGSRVHPPSPASPKTARRDARRRRPKPAPA